MKKIKFIIGILISILLTSCSYSFIVDQEDIENKGAFRVYSMTLHPSNKCTYRINSPLNSHNFVLIDSCYKYNIGDTLVINKRN